MLNWLKLSLLLVLAAAATTANDESASAKLLVSKQILNKYLVEGLDILIKYVSYNDIFDYIYYTLLLPSDIPYTMLADQQLWMFNLVIAPSALRILKLLVDN